MMRKWTACALFLVPAWFAGMILIVPSSGQPPSLRSVFNHPDCVRACWLGIEPGVTTQTEVQNITTSLGINYQVVIFSNDGEANGLYQWIPDETQPFINVDNVLDVVSIRFAGGVVSQIKLPVSIPLSMVISEYDAPIRVQEITGNTLELLYPNEGLIFTTNFGNQTITHLTLISADMFEALYSIEPNGGAVAILEDCSVINIPCPVATATPTPPARQTDGTQPG